MLAFKQYLDSIDPRLFYLAVALAVGAVIFAWKRWHPLSFYRLPQRARALPAAILGALAAASGSEDIQRAVVDAIIGVFAGITAVGGHEFVSRLLSAPKQGSKTKTKKDEEKTDVSAQP